MIFRHIIIAALIGIVINAAPARGQGSIEQIVAQKVQPILPGNGKGGGVAVAVRMNGQTRFFNYGFANDARNERVTAESIFNLGSVGKLFATTTLAEAVKRGELSLDDPVAKYVTELQRGGDIRRITSWTACESHFWIARHAGAIRAVASRQIHVARFRPVS